MSEDVISVKYKQYKSGKWTFVIENSGKRHGLRDKGKGYPTKQAAMDDVKELLQTRKATKIEVK